MFGSPIRGANAYAKVGVETGVIAASPHKLIVMLFEGAQIALNNALQYMAAGNIEEKGKAISKAIAIINSGLRASLDIRAGGEVAANLDALYEYMGNTLLKANLENKPELIQEVLTLLLDIKGAWDDITPASDTAAAPVNAPAATPYDALEPRTQQLMKA